MMGMAYLEGYSTKQFRKIYNQYKKAVCSENKEKMSALEQKYPFVTSCYNELDGCTTSMSAFVICIKMPLGELLDWNENKSDVRVSLPMQGFVIFGMEQAEIWKSPWKRIR